MEQLTKNQAVATSQEAVQNQNEPQLRDENAHNDKSVHGVDRKSGSAGMPRPISYAVFCLKKKRFDTLPGGPAAQTSYEHGEWRVMFTRSLATPDTANELQFAAGRAIPMAFFAWDGSSGEHGNRLAVSTWYFLALDQPTPPRVFVTPVVVMLLTLGLGIVVVRRVQRRQAGWGDSLWRDNETRDAGCGVRCVRDGERPGTSGRAAGRRDDRREDQVHGRQAGEPQDRHERGAEMQGEVSGAAH